VLQFWTDNWLGEPLVDLPHIDTDFHGHLKGTVSEVIVNGGWNFPAALTSYGDIKDCMEAKVLPTVMLPNVLVWAHAPDGILTSKLALSFLRMSTTLLPWGDQI